MDNFRERLQQCVINNGRHLSDVIFKSVYKTELYVLCTRKRVFCVTCFVWFLLSFKMWELFLLSLYFETKGNVYQSTRSKVLEDVTLPQQAIELNLAVFFLKLCPLCRQCYANSTRDQCQGPTLYRQCYANSTRDHCQGPNSKLYDVVVSNFETVTSNELGGWLRN